jgi:galactose mutarotase-like enzyme
MSYHQTSVAGFPAIALRGASLEIIVVPSIGMKLTNLRRPRGREWLWRSDQIPLAPHDPDATDYVDTADSGGWDECFPTIGPCALPADPGVDLPDHGELWTAAWTSALRESGDGTTLTAVARGRRLPYDFQREITVDREAPVARFEYRARNTGDAPFPWIWSSHPLLNIQPGSTIEVPGMTQVRLDAVHGRPDLASGDIVSWPGAIGGSADALRLPGPEARWALKCFGDAGPDGIVALVDPRAGERLEFRVDRGTVPQVGIWINCGGWASAGRTPYYNLALEPCIGAPDRLDQAVRDWHMAQQLAPGEERRWSLEVHLPEPA